MALLPRSLSLVSPAVPSSKAGDTHPPSSASPGDGGWQGQQEPLSQQLLSACPARRSRARRGRVVAMRQRGQGRSATRLPSSWHPGCSPDTHSLRDPRRGPGPPAESLLRRRRGMGPGWPPTTPQQLSFTGLPSRRKKLCRHSGPSTRAASEFCAPPAPVTSGQKHGSGPESQPNCPQPASPSHSV